MGTGNLTDRTNGQTIDETFFNDIHSALNGTLVGRNSSGTAASNQNLGSLAIPFGTLFVNQISLNGSSLDVSQITSAANRIVSGASRSLSSMPDFLRADGAALSFDVLGATTNLVLSINSTTATVTTDITKTGFTAAASSNNTATVNDSAISSDKFAGEEDYEIPYITISSAGSEITSRVGQFAVFETSGGEFMFAYIKSSTLLTNVRRGYFFDDSGDPIPRSAISNSDTLTIRSLGWVFVEDDGTTVDVTYTTPVYDFSAPSSPASGDYWFDIQNQIWKRYNGSSFEQIDRTLVGMVVANTSACVASRCFDFAKNFKEDNEIDLEIRSTEIIDSRSKALVANIYGSQVVSLTSGLSWNITTDLETGLTEASGTTYYIYLSDQGRSIISDQKPHLRPELKGYYHPFHSYRCLGRINNDGSSDINFVTAHPFNKKADVPWEDFNPFAGALASISQGFGTVSSVEMVARIHNGIKQIRGYFTCGTTTAVEARIAIDAIRTVHSKFSSNTSVGTLLWTDASNANIDPTATGGENYITMASTGGTGGSLAQENASTRFSSGDRVSIALDIPLEPV